MFKHLKYFVISLLFFSQGFAQAQEEAWTPRSPLKYPTSFHSLIYENKQPNISRVLDDACIAAIQEVIRSGRNFYSEVLKNEYTQLVSESGYSEVSDGEFFHYTKAHEMRTIAANQTYSKIFEFLRQNWHFTNWFLYVAADSSSSSHFGPYQIKFRLRPGAQIFYSNDKVSNTTSTMSGHEGNRAVELEQLAKNPTLSVCSGKGQGETGHYHPILTILAAEANQIDLIAYFGKHIQWFQLLGSWSIQQMSSD